MKNNWKFDDKKLREIYKKDGISSKMSYKEFRRLAEKYATILIETVKDGAKDEKPVEQ